jgi:predicted ATPase with chaperone activity
MRANQKFTLPFCLKSLTAAVLLGVLVACGSSDTTVENQQEVVTELSVGEKLAAIDGVLGKSAEYEKRISQAAERCGQEEIQVADYIVFAQRSLDERGQTVTLLEIVEEAILGSIPPSEAGTFKCSEVISLYVILRVN